MFPLQPELFPVLGLFGIALPVLIGGAAKVGGTLFGGGGTGCVSAGPQQETRDIMVTIRRDNAALFTQGLPIHEPTFAHLRSVADGSNEEAVDCPELQVEVAAFLAEYDQNKARRLGNLSVEPSGQFREEIQGAGQQARTEGPTLAAVILAAPMLLILAGVAAVAFVGFKLAKS